MFISLVETHCCVHYDNAFSVLPSAEMTMISAQIVLVRDYYSRLCSLQRHLEDGKK